MTLVADSVDDHDAVRALQAHFDFDELQARAVLAMQVRRFSAAEKSSLRAEIAELETENGG
ncbi:hypothetical protein HQ305_06815 [Rhodococcus sp. BP-149]|uniref:hypothetical protein n=1 Tax=unclassified Rhodococcus (in: high G+C Gram-positive bacteria) TaxID=192944 RepID=UPI001C9ACFB4|nr:MULTISPECIES: hypothetical protein [unclassified Rhodococcus (in: high G+C Gram-positive bacteria)]MBY6681854.1 hypothetical protein [Rhodococcus sp. BP-316]MBY6683984.1 hypothetical protein [Rhodococcus sp. BP-288]MBY6693355.1 hypothetical protein [Rhodococcus sp. BP-188]MBY6697552.1 hypothetical protein [Rhodococcus sp. BP-285]MBY6702229.1 hypothetical protein [Rhodococcus sp. BP-283]